MEAVTIRILGIDDLEAVRTLFFDVFSEAPWNDDWSNEEQLRCYLLDLMDAKSSLSLGLYEQDVLVGVSLGRVLHWYSGTEYQIQEFCIKAGEQKRCLGTRFLSLMEALLATRGIASILLATDRTVPAYLFYRKHGFSELKHLCFLHKCIVKE